MPTVLVVDDDREVAESHARMLQGFGCTSLIESVPEKVEPRLSLPEPVDLVLLDIQMPGLNGLDLLQRLRVRRPDIGVIMATVLNDLELAVKAIKNGAYNYLLKPIQPGKLQRVVESYFSNQPSRLDEDACFRPFVTSFPGFQEIFHRVKSFAQSDVHVLVSGETGTGKELIAQIIHSLSPRRDQGFRVVNLAALSPTLFESELFGHVRGSFTGATGDRAGHLEEAGRGTLLLDEIGELSPDHQTKLLRVLQNRTFSRVGESIERPLDARLVLATNADLRRLMKTGRIREDLYYRVSSHSVELPPLRERRSDIELLARYFLKKYATQFDRPVRDIADDALGVLARYPFPGNVRELEGIISAAVLLEQTPTVQAVSLPRHCRISDDEASDLEKARYRTIVGVLAECAGNQTRAAAKLGIARQTLNQLLKDYRTRGWIE
jgi:DNA-binding NtrC family response regulator